MKNSHIEWTDHTFNPWIGCTKVSPGCANCYAEARDRRFDGGIHWGKGAPRRRTSTHNWNEPRRLNRLQETSGAVHHGAARPRVFCASLADWLDEEVPIEWLHDLLSLIGATPHLDWQLLTKRPENWGNRLNAVVLWAMARDIHISPVMHWLRGHAPQNVWIGTTVEDQQRADLRIPQLLTIPARVRFLSCEPLLSRVDIQVPAFNGADSFSAVEGVHWVICGGESGLKARPMYPTWARDLRDQCKAAGVPFFFKQWGEFLCRDQNPAERISHEYDALGFQRIGKKAAGRLLDGVEHSAFPA